ncbi:MAG: hypothetical protein ACNA8W_10630 [Bradymonadaceae bacterium]
MMVIIRPWTAAWELRVLEPSLWPAILLISIYPFAHLARDPAIAHRYRDTAPDDVIERYSVIWWFVFFVAALALSLLTAHNGIKDFITGFFPAYSPLAQALIFVLFLKAAGYVLISYPYSPLPDEPTKSQRRRSKN